jgi:signal transduction histidine kinase
MSDTRRLGSLRLRITFAMLAVAAVGSSVFAASVFVAAERLERAVLLRHVEVEFDALAAAVRGDPGVRTVRSAWLVGYVGDDNPELPAELKDLPPGDYHAIRVAGKSYQVYVNEDHGRRIYVTYDITEWEALEQPVVYALFGGVVLSVLLAIGLGFWASRQIIAPVTALSARLRELDPRERSVRIAPEFSGEVSAIAQSFDRYMERLDGFVGREQLFTAAAAHELRTPLAVIQGATEVLAEQRDLPPAAERATARLERATRDMREFIEALLFLSREERQYESGEARCEIGHIVEQLGEDYRGVIEGKPVAIKVSVAGELWVDAPPALPTMVVSNLVRNAVEHTDTGEVRLELAGRELRIVDTGHGIPPNAQAQLFARGYSTKRGGGMGLHLAKRICDRFGWELTVASGEAGGTTARVVF